MFGKAFRVLGLAGSLAVLSVWALASISAVPTNAQAASTPTGTPGPAALATYAATDDGSDISIGLTNPQATPTTAPLGTPDANPIDLSGNGETPAGPSVPIKPINATPPPTLAELLKQFPSLQALLDSLKGQDLSKVDLSALYKNMVDIYTKNGATGLGVFLKDSGLLDQLGIPLSYLDLLVAYDKGGIDSVQKLAKQRGLINSKNELVATLVLADVTAADQVVTDLGTLGVTAYPPVDQDGLLSIGIPIDTLSNFQSPDTLIKFFIAISQVKNVSGIKLQIPHAPASHISNAALAYLKGVGPTTVGATAWQKAGITGKGVRVGVLDMGFGGIKGLMNGKDLPTAAHLHTNLTLDELDAQGETHGTECAQVVHGAAPDADLYVAFFDDSASFQAGLKYMLDNKVQILSYSIGSSIGPRDGTFGESLLVDQVVQKTDTLWVVAAGNEALDHTTFKYNDSVGDGQHHFDANNDSLPFVAYAPDTQVALNWNGNWKGGEKDEYDFSVLDKDGNEVATGAEAVKGRKNDLPFQIADFQTNPGDTYYLVVRKNHAVADNTIDVFINNAELPKWARVPDHSVTVPADSSSAFTVGATVLNKTKIEPFSSEGPTNDGRIKPDITAPDGEVLPDNADGFFGTSGATPLISGVAALVLQAYPKLSESELRAYLLKNVTDLGTKGPDSVFGAGQVKLPDPSSINAAGPNANNTPGPTKTPNPKVTPRATPKPTKVPPTAAPAGPTATATDTGSTDNGGGGSTSSGSATATITDNSVKFGVVSNGVKGVQINVTFEIDGLKDGTGLVAVQIFESDGVTPVKASKDNTIAGTLGTGKLLKPGFDQTQFNNFGLFLPNSAFTQLSKGKHNLSYVITVLDFSDENNPVILIQSDPIPITVTR